jgi:predicted MFS family arabinose efflux permease
VREISPKGFNASGQALFSTMYTGAGGIIGALGGSMLYEYYGPHTLFFSGAIAALIGIVLMVIFFRKAPAKAACATD